MLRTGKQVWEATAKRTALDLRLQELEFHVGRFTTVTNQASLLAGFAFEGLVHMEIPEDADPRVETAFWVTGSLAMMFSLYVLVAGSMVSILGHQLALLGASGSSLDDAVQILRNRRISIFGSAAMGLLCMVASAACMGQMKFGPAGQICVWLFGVFTLVTIYSTCNIFANLGNRELVTGATQIYTQNGYFDLAKLDPGANGHVIMTREAPPMQ